MNKTLVVFALILSGCAVHFTDKQGRDNYLGFVSIASEKRNCIVTITTKSVGITVDATRESGGINIGFKTLSKSYLRDGDGVVELINEIGATPTNIINNCGGREETMLLY